MNLDSSPACEGLDAETRWIARLGILSALIYLSAQTYQYVLFWLWPSGAGSMTDAIDSRISVHDQIRCVGILVSFLLLPNYYLAVATYLAKRRPVAAALGAAFSLMFVLIEILHRTVDCFFVSGRWASAAAMSKGAALEGLLVNIRDWDELTNAIYVPLLAAHLMALLYFLRATVALEYPWKAVLSATLIINCVCVVARLAEMAANAGWLASWNWLVYFPSTVMLYGSFTVWLLAQLRRAETSPAEGCHA
jgi:hypothetical protein